MSVHCEIKKMLHKQQSFVESTYGSLATKFSQIRGNVRAGVTFAVKPVTD